MAEKESLPQTETFATDTTASSRRSWQHLLPASKLKAQLPKFHPLTLKSLGHIGVAVLAIASAALTASNLNVVQGLERNSHTLFFDIRGPVEPPGSNPAVPDDLGIVILAIDGVSLSQYATVPTTNLQPIERWPWQRAAYAIAIERLMQAGARAVAIDLLFDIPSSYGPQDDEQLRRVLAKYPGRVTLASHYVNEVLPQGLVTMLLKPQPLFQSISPDGFINYVISPNGRIHELSRNPDQIFKLPADELNSIPSVSSFAEATLKASQLPYSPPQGKDIFFYGPSRSFTHISFWEILEPEYWNDYHVKNQTVKNKIVLIGGTDQLFQDFHLAPFSGTSRYPERMAGVEIQANSIATILEGKSISHLFSNRLLRGLAVCLLVIAAGIIQARSPRPLRRFAYGLIIACAWGAIAYATFVEARLILPTTVPIAAILLSSVSYLLTGVASDRIQLIQEAKKRRSSQHIRELLSATQQDDLKSIVEAYDQELIGRKLKNRYAVTQELASGGFGQTYLAQDSDRPGNPTCVVKRLRPASDKPSVMKLAEVLFAREAVIQELLGRHEQIPQLLAYFNEQDDFYLVQEYIEGKSLAEEFAMRSLLKPISEHKVILILHELLQILDFVHQHGVIHRDIKPANVIRRQSDGKLVLIDFGAVKQISQLEETEAMTAFTVAIGTSGYMAPEQASGRPSAASDLYSLGIMGIQALTGISASELDKKRDPNTHELLWKDNVQISHSLTKVLDKMVKSNIGDRYRSAKEVLNDLDSLTKYAYEVTPSIDSSENLPLYEEDDTQSGDETKPWPQTSNLIHSNPEKFERDFSDTNSATLKHDLENDHDLTLPSTDLDNQTKA